MKWQLRSFTDSLGWNIFLMTLGAVVYVLGYNGIAAHHDFVPGALYGFAVVGNNAVPALSLSRWYVLLNVPVFFLAWKGVSKRFFFLNLYSMLVVAVLTAYVRCDFGIQADVYSAIAAGALMGAGSGLILRTYGGGGGLDVLAVILNRKYGMRIGVFFFLVNALVMCTALNRFSPDTIVASLVMLFISSVVTEYVLSLFNQRKAVRILTRKGNEVALALTNVRKQHATVFSGKSGHSGNNVDMILSITDRLRLRSLEKDVFAIDPAAIIVIENTFSVIGGHVGPRKNY
ncbi:YitT family protein [uncultured Pseudodesulfovibrio sp.]|uniref:YitT family protein n=1 Tax=uncultured Pseudodesulfovibrio sp. TaxID=2035858 RepID=UPI0029C80463|nr:YitT family protein [uncultured Pseudodesulfovibrio sp.]